MDERERRLAANERFFRDVNEQIGGIARSQGTDRHFYEFLCECSNTDCDLMLPLRISEYELARQDATVFIVTPGHDLPDIETVVEHTSRYDLVRKHDEAAELAELDNPRR